MDKPVISIIIPCYNHGQYIDEAINSVKECNNDNYEIIVVNDGSSDSYTNKRLQELKEIGHNIIFQENKGLGKTRNKGIEMAQGKYILPLDADNKIDPKFLLKAVATLEFNPTISIVYCDRQLFGDSDDMIKVGSYNLSQLLNENYIDACTIYRKSMWEDIGGYDENMPLQGVEDWDFWLSAVEKGYNFYYIPEPLFYYRVVENSMLHRLVSNPDFDTVNDYVYKKHSLLLASGYKDLYKKFNSKLSKDNYLNQHPLKASIKYFLHWAFQKTNL